MDELLVVGQIDAHGISAVAVGSVGCGIGPASGEAQLRLDAGDGRLQFVLRHFLRTGGRSVQTPSNTSAAMPIDSLNVGCG